MTEILELVIVTLLLCWLLSIAYFLYRRIRLIIAMRKLGRIDGVEVKRIGNPFLSLICISRLPEFAVTVKDRLYLVRTYNGVGAGRAVHFASERFTVRYSQLTTAIYQMRRRDGSTVISRGGVSVGTRVFTVPELGVPDELITRDLTVVPVMIFNPAPGEVSYVTPEKNSIRIAFTGDEVKGTKIFTLQTFLVFIDRESRRKEKETARLFFDE